MPGSAKTAYIWFAVI